MTDDEIAPQSRKAWQFVQQMLTDVTEVITADAQTERELLEGLRVIARISSLCAQLSVEADPERPRFFDMSPPGQMAGGPNPDGNYYLAMIRGYRTYRVTGTRGTTAYLGFQILAGTGLTPRRMSGYVSDTDLALADGEFALVLSAHKPERPRACDVGADPRGRIVDRRARVRRRRGHRTSREPEHRHRRSRCAAATFRR